MYDQGIGLRVGAADDLAPIKLRRRRGVQPAVAHG